MEMGIFTRFRDIVSSNINAMLDRAENPEKMIKLMIHEMEDTLVELKASCAGVMASSKKVQRELQEIRSHTNRWHEKAQLAVEKGRDDLAREALVEKRRYAGREERLERELEEHDNLVGQYKEDIRQLEEKLGSAREKQRILVHRHVHAANKKRAENGIRRVDSSEAVLKFDELESRIERMESEADLVNSGRKTTLEEEFEKLSVDDEIENELKTLKHKEAVAGEGQAV